MFLPASLVGVLLSPVVAASQITPKIVLFKNGDSLVCFSPEFPPRAGFPAEDFAPAYF
jgi:hypothetical protein